MRTYFCASVLVWNLVAIAGCSSPDDSSPDASAAFEDATTNTTDGGFGLDLAIDMSIQDAGPDASAGDASLDASEEPGDIGTSDANTDASNGDGADAADAADMSAVMGPDTCDSAVMLVADASGFVSRSGSFAGLSNTLAPSQFCTVAGPGADAFYTFEIPPGLWDVRVDTIGSTADTALTVGFDCRSLGQSICNNDYEETVSKAGRVWLHRFRALQATTLYIAVDDASGFAGDYLLNVQRTPASADQCPSALSRPLDISGGGAVLGFLEPGTGQASGTCEGVGTSGVEAVFLADATGTTAMKLDAVSSDFVPDLHVRQGSCNVAQELGCALGSGVGGIGQASLSVVPAMGAQHFIFLEGGVGSYVLTYEPN